MVMSDPLESDRDLAFSFSILIVQDSTQGESRWSHGDTDSMLLMLSQSDSSLMAKLAALRDKLVFITYDNSHCSSMVA